MIRHLLFEGLALVRRRLFASVALIVALAMPVALGGVTFSVELWLKPLLHAATAGSTVEVLLRPGLSGREITAWIGRVRAAHPQWMVRRVPPHEMARRLSVWFPYLKPLLARQPRELLPDTVEISAPDARKITALASDSAILAVGPETSLGPQLRHFAARLSWIVGAIAAVLLFAAALFAGIWVHLELFRHADEISIMRLVGATEPSVQGPFLVAVGVTGALAGILAVVLDLVILRWLTTLLRSVGLPPLEGHPGVAILQLLVATLVPLGVAAFTLSRHATLDIEE